MNFGLNWLALKVFSTRPVTVRFAGESTLWHLCTMRLMRTLERSFEKSTRTLISNKTIISG